MKSVTFEYPLDVAPEITDGRKILTSTEYFFAASLTNCSETTLLWPYLKKTGQYSTNMEGRERSKMKKVSRGDTTKKRHFVAKQASDGSEWRERWLSRRKEGQGGEFLPSFVFHIREVNCWHFFFFISTCR